MNKVFLIGNVGQDPEVTKHNDQSLGKFSLATTRHYSKNGEKLKDTQWHSISVWNSKAIDYIKKGSKVAVIGRIDYREYEKDGLKRVFTQIIAEEIQLLDKPSDKNQTNEGLPF